MLKAALLVVVVVGSVVDYLFQTKGTPIQVAPGVARILYGYAEPAAPDYPCDANHLGVLFYNLSAGMARPTSICDGTNWVKASTTAPILSTTATVGGALIALNGSVTSPDTAAPGAIKGEWCGAAPADGSFIPDNVMVKCYVPANDIVRVRVSAPVIAVVPPAVAYSVVVPRVAPNP